MVWRLASFITSTRVSISGPIRRRCLLRAKRLRSATILVNERRPRQRYPGGVLSSSRLATITRYGRLCCDSRTACLIFHLATTAGTLSARETLYNSAFVLTLRLQLGDFGWSDAGRLRPPLVVVCGGAVLLALACATITSRHATRVFLVLALGLFSICVSCRSCGTTRNESGCSHGKGSSYRTLLLGSCAGFAFAQGWVRPEHVQSAAFRLSLSSPRSDFSFGYRSS